MTLESVLEGVSSRDSFVHFLEVLRADLTEAQWENATLPRFLEAMAAWGADPPTGDEAPSWRGFAEMFMAARVYE